MTQFDIAALFIALVLSTGLLVAVVAAVWWFDRYDREPLQLVAGVFAWGALAAPVLAVVCCSALGPGLGVSMSSLAGWLGPLVEEIAKALGIGLVILLSREFDNPTDGVVYGTAAGLGFAATENLVYTIVGAQATPIDGTLVVVLVRTALAAGIHAVSSATLGGCLGFAYLSRRSLDRFAWGLAGLSGAVLIHGGWNVLLLRLGDASATTAPARWLIVVVALYALYVVALALFLRSEQRILGTELSEEVELDVVPAWVAEVIPYYRRRIRSEWWPSRRERTVLARLLTRLAFRKHAVRRLPKGEAELAGLEVMRLRQRVRVMLGVLDSCQTSVETTDPFVASEPSDLP
ncbi:MAG: PrsW family intramembrane metalloprotease [Holophagae bacterium]